MSRPSALLKRVLIFAHRWLGVALSVIFTMWFLSGIVMMYWTYPEVSAKDRLQRAPRLDPAHIAISPEQAFAAVERAPDSGPSTPLGPGALRLGSFDGRAVYRLSGGGSGRGAPAIVYADDGSVQRVVDAPMMDRAAAAWAGRPRSDAAKQRVEDVDQWTVGSLRNVRPLFKYAWPDGQQVYVNGNTGEVVQYTTTASRFWAYLGAIPHWLYFTPLRKHQPEWFSFVVWSSFVGTIAALLGLAIIIWMYSPRKQYRYAVEPTSIPYRGWKRWHAITGLFFGIVTTTWAFSGLLSMGPFPIMNRLTDLTVPAADNSAGRGRSGAATVANALRGGGGLPLSDYAGRSPRDAIAAARDFDVKELEWTSFAGEPLYLATNGRGETLLVPMAGDPRTTVEPDDVMRVVRGALGEHLGEIRVLNEYDAYYLDRRGERPLPVVYARLNDAVATRYYIDPKTATVVGQYSARGWVNRWLYHGLHSLDFPWLYKYRPLWDIVVIGLMLGGTALCVTSLVMTWRVVARKLAAVLRARVDLPNEDLATWS